MKTKTEILVETKEYYAADPSKRAATTTDNKYVCKYLTPDGRMCAFGRCEISPSKCVNGTVSSRFFRDEELMNAALKPEYRGHSIEFWYDVQSLHDTSEYWNESGLTEEGESYYNNLLDKYKD